MSLYAKSFLLPSTGTLAGQAGCVCDKHRLTDPPCSGELPISTTGRHKAAHRRADHPCHVEERERDCTSFPDRSSSRAARVSQLLPCPAERPAFSPCSTPSMHAPETLSALRRGKCEACAQGT